MDETKQRVAFFKTRIHENRWLIVIPSVVAYIFSAGWIFCHRSAETTPKDPLHLTHWSSVLLIFLWCVGPPLFFLGEYAWIGRKTMKDENLPSAEAFKYTQDLASKFWLAGLLLLVFLYEKGGFLKGEEARTAYAPVGRYHCRWRRTSLL